VEWLKPKMTFKQVISKYGYPFISKEVSECVQGARKYLTQVIAENSLDRPTDRPIPYKYWYERVTGTGAYQKHRTGETPHINDRSMFSQEKYSFFLDAPFEISNKCCNVMKKDPAHRYHKQTGRNPMTAQMATESRLRTQKWLQNGCNGFDLKIPTSNPMAFWTEQDVLLYILTNHIPICSVYGDIVKDGEIEGQMDLEDVYGKELVDLGRPTLKTTGCSRTG
jgi:hypothetical protein